MKSDENLMGRFIRFSSDFIRFHQISFFFIFFIFFLKQKNEKSKYFKINLHD